MIDIKDVDASFLNSEVDLANAMVELINETKLTMLSYHCHSLVPIGVSCVGVLLESHVGVKICVNICSFDDMHNKIPANLSRIYILSIINLDCLPYLASGRCHHNGLVHLWQQSFSSHSASYPIIVWYPQLIIS